MAGIKLYDATGQLVTVNATVQGDGSYKLTVDAGATAVAGDGTIAAGGTAQNLFSGTTPTNGFAVYNPDATNDLWISDSGSAVANGQGSIRVPANGGGYETPHGYKPIGAVSIVGAVTGQKFTARRY